MNNPPESGQTDRRRIWLTGADSEIGCALAGRLLRAGHALALTAPDQAQLLDLVERYPSQVLPVAGDIHDGRQLQDMADRVVARWGALDSAICLDTRGPQSDTGSRQARIKDGMLGISLYAQEALLLLRQGHHPHLVGVATAASQTGTALRQAFTALSANLIGQGINVSVMDLSDQQPLAPDNAAQRIFEQLSRADCASAGPRRFVPGQRLLAMVPARARLALARWLARSRSSKNGR